MRLRGCNPEAFRLMASPVAHSFAGFWTFLLLTARLKVRLATACRQYLPQLVLLVLLANLADVDFLFGLGVGADLHHGFIHSLAAAVFVALFGESPLFIFWHTAHIFSLICSPAQSSDGMRPPLAFLYCGRGRKTSARHWY